MTDWETLYPGDILRWFNMQGGIEHVFIIAVIPVENHHTLSEGSNVLCYSRSIGLDWIDEIDLLDSKLLNERINYR